MAPFLLFGNNDQKPVSMKDDRWYHLGQYTIYFLIYSFIGAIFETIYRLFTEGHLYGIHGFLAIPIFPIYGFGALLIITLLGPRFRHPVLIFLTSVTLTAVLEFFSSWLIQMIFGVWIWDYHREPFNLDGRISLESSVGFGLAALALVYFIHPQISNHIKRIPKRPTMMIAGIIAAVLIFATVQAIIKHLGRV